LIETETPTSARNPFRTTAYELQAAKAEAIRDVRVG
jgi:hypothetical protein